MVEEEKLSKEELEYEEEIKKTLDESIDEIDSSMKTIGGKFSNLLLKISEDKISKIWDKGRLILKHKLREL